MRAASLSLDFAIILVALVVLLHAQKTNAYEICPQENCLPAEQCEELVKEHTACMLPNTVCCSVVKLEYRTACRHWGGECMDKCTSSLTRTATDCPNNQNCCVLV